MVPPTDIGPAMDDMLDRSLKFKKIGGTARLYLLEHLEEDKLYSRDEITSIINDIPERIGIVKKDIQKLAENDDNYNMVLNQLIDYVIKEAQQVSGDAFLSDGAPMILVEHRDITTGNLFYNIRGL